MNPTPIHYKDIGVENVRAFHNKFGVPMSPVPALLDKAAHEYRAQFMQEELNEFNEAFAEGNLDKAFDALLDLVYVAKGTALIMGCPWDDGWARVQFANMTKRLAKPDGSDSKRNNPLDVIKPEGFVPPQHWDLLGLAPGATAPVFNATAAVLRRGEERRDPNMPVVDITSFVETTSDRAAE